jgi:hypothetical protein
METKPFIIMEGERIVLDTTTEHYPQLEKIDKRYLGLTGCIFKLDYYRDQFGSTMESFKRDFFDPDERIVLHAKDIMQKSGPFHVLQNEDVCERFNAGLLDIIANAQYTVINVVLDKKNHRERYVEAWHPYHYCLANMLMRYCFFLGRHRAKGDVMAESRGATEDMALKTAYARLFANGNQLQSGAFFQQHLTSKEIKIKPKINNVAGLQLADMLAHPLKKYTLLQKGILAESDGDFFWKKVVEAAKPKIDCRVNDGRIDGYGLVFV